jgi:DnaJ family protein C protein 11
MFTQCAVRLSYLRQKWTLPIVLSPENNETLAFYSIIIPSTALALGYHFVLKPRRRAQRATYFDAARRTLKEERSAVMRDTENTILLLREPARRHMDAERALGGDIHVRLQISPSSYSPR